MADQIESLEYDRMVENALRGVVRDALTFAAEHGLPGEHHFYITFLTPHPDVEIPDSLSAAHPDEMTIVLQHQFWNLLVGEDHFEVTLSFNRMNERLVIPFEAVTAFADPSAKFGLQFKVEMVPEDADIPDAEIESLPEFETETPAAEQDGQDTDENGEPKSGEVVSLDAFRKK